MQPINTQGVRRKVRLIEPWIKDFIQNRGLHIMRSTIDDRPLNVSYSEEGLKWTALEIQYRNRKGELNPFPKRKLLYFANARLKHRKQDGYQPTFVGDLTKNPNIYVEQFKPKDHYILNSEGEITYETDWGNEYLLDEDGNKIPRINSKLQAYEFVWCNKAMKMLIPMNVDRPSYVDK